MDEEDSVINADVTFMSNTKCKMDLNDKKHRTDLFGNISRKTMFGEVKLVDDMLNSLDYMSRSI